MMMRRYFLLAFALCWALTLPIALQVQGLVPLTLVPPALQWLIGFAPLLAAAWVTRGRPERGPWLEAMARWRVAPHWILAAILLPWLAAGLAFAGRAGLGGEVPALHFTPDVAAFALAWLVLAFGEEAGWRGLALPQLLARFGFWGAAGLLGVLWAVWHYPKLFCSPYLRLDATGAFAIFAFTVQILIANVLLCWLFLRTGSVLACTLFHASFNVLATVYWRAALDPGVTGALLLLTIVLLVLDRARLPGRQVPAAA